MNPWRGVPETSRAEATRVVDWSPDELGMALRPRRRAEGGAGKAQERGSSPGERSGSTLSQAVHAYPDQLGGRDRGTGRHGALRPRRRPAALPRGVDAGHRSVLSRFLSAILTRTFEQAEVDEGFAAQSILIVNGLTDASHPLQALRRRDDDPGARSAPSRPSALRISATATTSATR